MSSTQALIQAFLFTAVFPKRLIFFTVDLVQWLRWVAPYSEQRTETLWNLCQQISVMCICLGILKKKLTRKIRKLSFMRVCKYLNQRVTRIGE